MGLDKVLIEFWKLVFLVPPTAYSVYTVYTVNTIYTVYTVHTVNIV